MKLSEDGIRRPAFSIWFNAGFRVFKINKKQAMEFTGKQLCRLCGDPLQEGERYRGYIILDQGFSFVEIGYLEGSLVKCSVKDLIKLPEVVPDCLKRGQGYKVVGNCWRVQTFGDCDFTSSAQALGMDDYQHRCRLLQEKLLNMAANGSEKEFCAYEEEILERYFGSDWQKFFK